MPASRNYSSTAGLMHLVGSITGAAASLIVDVTTGLPTVPFTLMLDPSLGVEEVVTVTAVGGTTLTVTRGVGGTSAQAHTNGAEVRHAYYGQDFQDSRDHEANTTTAHGATGAVVGTTNTQTLTGKTMSGASNTFSNVPTTALTNGPITATTGTFSGDAMAANLFKAVAAEVTTNAAATSATANRVLVTAPSVTGDGIKRFKITGSFWCATGTVSGTEYGLELRDSTLGVVVSSRSVHVVSGFIDGVTFTTSDVPAVGSHAYQFAIHSALGTSTATVLANATAPTEIIVEQI